MMNIFKLYCKVTTKNNQVPITPLINRCTTVCRVLSLGQIASCLSAGAIVENIDTDGKLIKRLNFKNLNNITKEKTTIKNNKPEELDEAKNDTSVSAQIIDEEDNEPIIDINEDIVDVLESASK